MSLTPLVYEYTFVTKFGTINITPEEFSKYTEEQANQSTAQMFASMSYAVNEFVPTYGDGTWQVVSHDVAIYGSRLIVSFLLRHLVTPPKAHQTH